MATVIQNPVSRKKGGACNPETEAKALLKQYGTLKRQGTHYVYDVFGQNVIIAKSWSDRRAAQNNLSVIRRILSQNVPAF